MTNVPSKKIQISLETAVAVLAEAARTDPVTVTSQLTAAGFEVVGFKQPQSEKIVAPAISKIIKFQPNKLVEGKGIYFTVLEPRDESGKSLNKAYNAFAADKDLARLPGTSGTVLNFWDTVSETSNLRHVQGHDGIHLEDHIALYRALKDGSYNGQFFVPTCELLYGKDSDGNSVAVDSLFANRGKGDFAKPKHGFMLTPNASGDRLHWYWSLTERRVAQRDCVRLPDGSRALSYKGRDLFSCRPVRLEPAL